MTGRAHTHRVVCKSSKVPEGWVIVAECHSPACPGDDLNGWVIKRPGERELVCAVSPLPEGYRQVRGTRSESCPGTGENALVIERSPTS